MYNGNSAGSGKKSNVMYLYGTAAIDSCLPFENKTHISVSVQVLYSRSNGRLRLKIGNTRQTGSSLLLESQEKS